MDGFLASLIGLFAPQLFLLAVVGTVGGVFVGSIPGLSGTMLISLCLPITFYMEPVSAVVLLVAIYTGSITGGLISATLMRTPGTVSNVMTTLDAYPLARKGQAQRALSLGIAASFAGSIFGWLALAILAKPLSNVAIKVGSAELFALVVLALALISSVSSGSMLKGLIMGAVGIILALPGVDPTTGVTRLTMGFWQLNGGFHILPVLVGIFAVAPILGDILDLDSRAGEPQYRHSRKFLFSFADVKRFWNLILRSSTLGTIVGILPGVGGNVASVVAYTSARVLSRKPKEFGQGSEEGIVASESANNASVGGALIPLITLGIPGSVVDVLLIGALMMHDIAPGPMLFITNAPVAWTLVTTLLVSSVLMLLTMIYATGPISRLIGLPKQGILPVILVFCVVGVYATTNRMFDVWVMIAFGFAALLFERARFPMAPLVIGFVLAPIAEKSLRSGLMASDGDVVAFLTTPLSLVLLFASFALFVWPIVQAVRSWVGTSTAGR
ncbi:tripartite tricarboxylate transporter permease [Pelagibius sp.]|uniref:tripartite tricarboxylate transporter permease n=1 Tax=Pelagibius sp. TaxID=1931238 RepID=UPI002602AB62|nr:tripartite tricarboxylate transporter permease [Pelagibius sp.]